METDLGLEVKTRGRDIRVHPKCFALKEDIQLLWQRREEVEEISLAS
jgi:hypothetical protein